jgi:hypothetical protein
MAAWQAITPVSAIVTGGGNRGHWLDDSVLEPMRKTSHSFANQGPLWSAMRFSAKHQWANSGVKRLTTAAGTSVSLSF